MREALDGQREKKNEEEKRRKKRIQRERERENICLMREEREVNNIYIYIYIYFNFLLQCTAINSYAALLQHAFLYFSETKIAIELFSFTAANALKPQTQLIIDQFDIYT